MEIAAPVTKPSIRLLKLNVNWRPSGTLPRIGIRGKRAGVG
jgi:hypothetical protein